MTLNKNIGDIVRVQMDVKNTANSTCNFVCMMGIIHTDELAAGHYYNMVSHTQTIYLNGGTFTTIIWDYTIPSNAMAGDYKYALVVANMEHWTGSVPLDYVEYDRRDWTYAFTVTVPVVCSATISNVKVE